MKSKTFKILFYFFTTLFLLDFMLIILGSRLDPCEECAGKETLVLIPILSFFWFWFWYIMYISFFMKRYSELKVDSKNQALIKRFHMWWIIKIQKSIKYDKYPILTRVTAIIMMFPLCFGATWAFFKLSERLLVTLIQM